MLLIDGHNLIPKIAGLSLHAIDDEQQLIALLQVYARLRRKKIEVFFDGAPPGQAGVRSYGTIRAYFVPLGLTADEAIHRHLTRLGKAAHNNTVVSSDNEVQGYAREARAQVISSEDFARDLIAAQTAQNSPSNPPASVSPQGLDQWYHVFGLDPHSAEQPIEIHKEKKTTPPRSSPGRKHHGFLKK